MKRAAQQPSPPSWNFLSTFRAPDRSCPPTWSVFDTFSARAAQIHRIVSWKHLDALILLGRRAAAVGRSELEGELSHWHDLLGSLGGDPSRVDFTDFRPLRPSREETWSDWLQHLLKTSSSGAFAQRLLGHAGAHADARRELATASGFFRSDLVVFWTEQAATHVEVKVGDLHLDKTYPTAQDVEARWPEVRDWQHIILLPEEHLKFWRRITPPSNFPRRIDSLTWNNVAFALRHTLLHHKEPLHWRVWAWTFCGVIEQKLLGMPRFGSELLDASASILSRYLDLLRRARGGAPVSSGRQEHE